MRFAVPAGAFDLDELTEHVEIRRSRIPVNGPAVLSCDAGCGTL